jgi:hypothetical protein
MVFFEDRRTHNHTLITPMVFPHSGGVMPRWGPVLHMWAPPTCTYYPPCLDKRA